MTLLLRYGQCVPISSSRFCDADVLVERWAERISLDPKQSHGKRVDTLAMGSFGHHSTSTAAIGEDGDAQAVLDSRFRVRVVRVLRVVDAFVFRGRRVCFRL